MGWGVSTLVFMCTHGTLLVVDVWYVGWGGVGCVNVGVHVYTWYVGWGGVGWGVYNVLVCVHMVRCWWCVDVYTWYAAGVLMCTHGMCTHGALLVC